MAAERSYQRQDVLAGLEALAAEPQVDETGRDPRWPDPTNAVHWVVDDTWWDHSDPRESIGTVLVSEEEAEAVHRVVALIAEVSDRQGPQAPDAAWYLDPAWSQVRAAANRAVALFRSNEG